MDRPGFDRAGFEHMRRAFIFWGVEDPVEAQTPHSGKTATRKEQPFGPFYEPWVSSMIPIRHSKDASSSGACKVGALGHLSEQTKVPKSLLQTVIHHHCFTNVNIMST